MISEIVWVESGKTYSLDIKKLSYNFRKKEIRIRNSELKCIDTIEGKSYCNIKINELYLSLGSWQKLLYDQKLEVDDLNIVSPEFIFYRGSINETKSSNRPIADALDALKKIRQRFGIRHFEIKNATLVIHRRKNDDFPFIADKINFRAIGFSENTSLSKNFLSADDIDFDIKNQKWNFPKGNSISFSDMRFSGKSQVFEIDSCAFSFGQSGESGGLSFSAEKTRCTSHDLSAIYINNQLLLDTIFLAHPVMDLSVPAKNHSADTSTDFSTVLNKLFGDVNIKYIQVDGGSLSLNAPGKKGSSYKSKTTDLIISDFDINHDSVPSVSIGNIDLRLSEVEVATADSQYVLRINKFGLTDDNLICHDATFGPTSKNIVNAGLQIRMPAFILNHVSLSDIVQKRFKASSGIIIDPIVTIMPRKKGNSLATLPGKHLNNLYHSLNGLAQLIIVDRLDIKNANLEILPEEPSAALKISLKNMNATVELNRFLQSEVLMNIKEAIPRLTIENISITTPGMTTEIAELILKGKVQQNYMESVSVNTSNGLRLIGKKLFWEKFDWDRAMNLSEVYMDSVDLQSLAVEVLPVVKPMDSLKKNNLLSALGIRKINVAKAHLIVNTREDENISSNMNDIHFENLSITNDDINWKLLASVFANFEYQKNKVKVKVASAKLKSDEKISLSDISYEDNRRFVVISSAELTTRINSIRDKKLHFNTILLDQPVINFFLESEKSAPTPKLKKTMPLREIFIDSFLASNGSFNYKNFSDSLSFSTDFNMHGSSLSVNKTITGNLGFESLGINLLHTAFKNKKINGGFPLLNAELINVSFSKAGQNKFLRSGVHLVWSNGNIIKQSDSTSRLELSRISGQFHNDQFIYQFGNKLPLHELLPYIDLSDASLLYGNDKVEINADSLRWVGSSSVINTGRVSIFPLADRNDFFKSSQWQKEYIRFSSEGMAIIGLDVKKLTIDTSINIREINLRSPLLYASRNKQIPFQHGIEILMPTKLISTISFPMHIDSLLITNGAIDINEISAITGREGSVKISELDASIKSFTNRPSLLDSLRVSAKGGIFGQYVRSFKYRESYSDSLSGFRMSVRISPLELTRLSLVTNPLASVNVEKGNSDTLFARISGNKYASYGEMNFFYRDIKIRLLDHQDTTKKNFRLSFETLLANSFVLKSSNNKTSDIFFLRDKEKFVFNYWIKSLFSGIMTSAGVKTNKKYLKNYEAVKNTYSLPFKAE